MVGSSCEMWKTGCTEQNWLGSHNVKEWEPGVPMIS